MRTLFSDTPVISNVTEKESKVGKEHLCDCFLGFFE